MDLQQLIVGSKPGQRERGIGACDQYQMQRSWKLIDEKRQGLMNLLLVNNMILFKNQQPLTI